MHDGHLEPVRDECGSFSCSHRVFGRKLIFLHR
jgi:hypothetical protein